MKVEIKINSTIKEDKVVIYAKEITEEIKKIVFKIKVDTL